MMNPANRGLNSVLTRITNKLQQDSLVHDALHELRECLDVNRVALYYFYSHWQGQVTFEALSDHKYSIICSTGADECFKRGYADLYVAGRIYWADDIETAPISDCHRDFLRSLQVRSNLVAPVLNNGKLWGLLVAHHCQDVKKWEHSDITSMRLYSQGLSAAPSIQSEVLDFD
ncbi:MAG: GAF domain-containing protein [Pseudanabaena sp.]